MDSVWIQVFVMELEHLAPNFAELGRILVYVLVVWIGCE